MKAAVLHEQGSIDNQPLRVEQINQPSPKRGEILIKADVCGVCHTDLHIVEGDLEPPHLPLVPGHQVVGEVAQKGEGVSKFEIGDKVGVPWLHSTCGRCKFCQKGLENLCDNIQFTGFHADGGFAEFMISPADFSYPLPQEAENSQIAPLLCGGVIGYRALKLSEVQGGENLGLYGFGSSAHMVIQIANHLDVNSFVFTRSKHHRRLAQGLGAKWVGEARDTPPEEMDASIIFAPAGWIVPEALRVLDKGGRLITAGIHMSPIPKMDYNLLYEERSVSSVANSTKKDVTELLDLAVEIPIETNVETYSLSEINHVLQKLKESKIEASAVVKLPRPQLR